jgi:tRNA modification GTPase
MQPDPNDTIVALSSAPGPGGRAVVRLSGAEAFRITNTILQSIPPPDFTERSVHEGGIRLPGITQPLPAMLLLWPQPATYTGQDMVELHVLSSPPLVELLIAELLKAGARAAQPGEFTMRAFLAGKLDLTRAEAVLAVIEAGDRDELKQALAQLAGGMARPLQELRDDLLNLLADVEAGLDFAEEDIHFVQQDDLLMRLGKALAFITLLGKQIDQRSVGGRPLRVVLAGKPNAGKSSLFNALAGRAAALVSSEPGTTRDYLVHRLDLGGVIVELVDTAGWQKKNGHIETQAQLLSKEQAERADLVLLCLDATKERDDQQKELLEQQRPPVLGVATKCDLAKPPADLVMTSVVERTGIAELRKVLADRARAQARPALAPSLSRCRHHVDACLEHLRRAHAVVLHNDPPEVFALELRGALEQPGEMVGAVYTDDLLDRIFSRFCIGK